MKHQTPPHVPFIQISQEPFEALWPNLDALTQEHSREVEPESPRKFKLDIPRMIEADRLGFIRIWTLRVDGQLRGYCSWNVMWDLESEGLPIATQGAWFVSRNVPWGSAGKLFMASLQGLRSIGIQCCFPHHRMQGRGEKLGRFFESLGGIPTQQTYLLWIGDKNA